MTDRSLEQTQENTLLTLIGRRLDGLDRSRPVTVVRPCRADGDLPHHGSFRPLKAEHFLAFNDMPETDVLTAHLNDLQDDAFGYATMDIIFPNGDMRRPMGARAYHNGELYEVDGFCAVVAIHTKRAQNLTEYTVAAFDAAWDADGRNTKKPIVS